MTKIDFKSALLQTGDATGDVFVVRPRECSTRYCFYWFILAAAYRLVNASANWQKLSNNLLSSLGFTQLLYVTQLFYCINKTALAMAAIKEVDEVLLARPCRVIDQIIILHALWGWILSTY